MAAVFDTPVATVGSQQLLRIGFCRQSAGDAIGDVTGGFAGFFLCGLALDNKGLTEVREVQVAIECGGGPDFANFDSAVIRRVGHDKIRERAVVKKERDVFKETGLVVFDGEVVMGVTLPDQVIGDMPLGQKGIGGNIFALDIDGIQQRDGGFDFVGALELIVRRYGQGADFFWV